MILKLKKKVFVNKKNDRFVLMISRSILALFLFVLSATCFAQEGFKFGPQVAFISSRTHVLDSLPDNFNFRFKSGFKFGFTAQYGFTPKFVLSSGLSFVNKGFRVFNDTNSKGNLIKSNLSHIELPVNMILKFRMGASSRMRFLLGGTLNYQIKTTEKILANDGSTFVIREKNQNQIYPLLNTGVEIASENKAGNVFVFGVYYSQAFSNQSILHVSGSKNTSSDIFSLGYRGSYIGIGLSYLFDLKNFKKEEVFFY
jgi:hypothetical protein